MGPVFLELNQLAPSKKNQWHVGRGGHHIYKSKEARNFEGAVQEKLQGITVDGTDFAIMIRIFQEGRRRRDIDNMEGTIFDALNHSLKTVNEKGEEKKFDDSMINMKMVQRYIGVSFDRTEVLLMKNGSEAIAMAGRLLVYPASPISLPTQVQFLPPLLTKQ